MDNLLEKTSLLKKKTRNAYSAECNDLKNAVGQVVTQILVFMNVSRRRIITQHAAVFHEGSQWKDFWKDTQKFRRRAWFRSLELRVKKCQLHQPISFHKKELWKSQCLSCDKSRIVWITWQNLDDSFDRDFESRVSRIGSNRVVFSNDGSQGVHFSVIRNYFLPKIRRNFFRYLFSDKTKMSFFPLKELAVNTIFHHPSVSRVEWKKSAKLNMIGKLAKTVMEALISNTGKHSSASHGKRRTSMIPRFELFQLYSVQLNFFRQYMCSSFCKWINSRDIS